MIAVILGIVSGIVAWWVISMARASKRREEAEMKALNEYKPYKPIEPDTGGK